MSRENHVNSRQSASPWLPDTPAYSGFKPKPHNWLCLEAAQADQFESLILKQIPLPSEPIQIERLQTEHDFPFGFYRLSFGATDETQPWFIKVVNHHQAKRQAKANQVVTFLADRRAKQLKNSFATSVLLTGFPQQVTAEVSVLAYGYIDGRFLQPTLQDMQRLGKALAELHAELKSYPQQQVKSHGLKRHQHLKDLLEQLMDTQQIDLQNRVLAEALMAVFQHYPPTKLDVLIEKAQCVHGDTNVGNIWLASDERLVFLDFEDALTAWFSPFMDLVFALERFVLLQESEQGKTVELAQALLQSYQEQTNLKLRDASHIEDILQALAVRALLLLMEVSKQNAIECDAEMEKFLYLYNWPLQNRALLQKIFA
ncbi:phosphotransferase [Thiomicrorhabdus sediminis]|uniref:Aminoglycoside phosphotransferase domain-containing protein n=1 Tax=Thiomicrorhabdus sediminis TaxID=2580412 RepID=A0A4P9K6J0_9GAMM|nr:phosphotransferase [Thiomicrorhabdus sediminis]QCU90471.1 hypothetical protein FE785_07415 [Thiomicrorhabdus sediminis]